MQSPEGQGMGEEYAQLEAGMAERIDHQWCQDVQTFRDAFLNKFDGIIKSGETGWIHFDYMHPDPLTSELSTKEVLLIKLSPKGKHSSKSGNVAQLKIVTNETFTVNGKTQCLSEDILIDDDDDVMYFMDAVVLHNENKQEINAPTRGQAFAVPGDNKLLFTNFQVMPPRPDVSFEDGPDPVFPYGPYDSRTDRQYNLERAWALLTEIWEEYHKHTGTS